MKNKQKRLKIKEKNKNKVVEEHGKQLIKFSGEKDSLELLKQKEIFDELVNEKMFDINKLSEETDFNNLTYYYTSKNAPKYFFRFKGPLIVYNDIKNGRISLQKEEKIQEEFRSEVNEIFKGNPHYKSDIRESTIKNIKKALQWAGKSS